MLEIGSIARADARGVRAGAARACAIPAAGLPQVIEQINATGYGLTHGIHTRIDEKVEEDLREIKAGNIYVNRNIVGAVVGVQPFGGHGLSGTGPKAGGPLYLHRLVRSEKPPELHGETVPVAFDALQALQAALPKLHELGAGPAQPAADPDPALSGSLAAERARCSCPGRPARTTGCGSSRAARSAAQARRLQQLLEQLAAAWATGNRAVVPDTDLGRRLVRMIGHPDIAFAPDLVAADIDALLFAGCGRCRRRAAAAARRRMGK